MAIADQLVAIVGNHDPHAGAEGVDDFSYHPDDNERLQGSRHCSGVGEMLQSSAEEGFCVFDGHPGRAPISIYRVPNYRDLEFFWCRLINSKQK